MTTHLGSAVRRTESSLLQVLIKGPHNSQRPSREARDWSSCDFTMMKYIIWSIMIGPLTTSSMMINDDHHDIIMMWSKMIGPPTIQGCDNVQILFMAGTP